MSAPQIPKQHKAAIVEKQGGEVSVRDVDTPQKLNRGEVLVNIKYSGICHTDLHAQIGGFRELRIRGMIIAQLIPLFLCASPSDFQVTGLPPPSSPSVEVMKVQVSS